MCFGISEDKPEQQETEGTIFQRGQRQSKMSIARHEHRTGEHLHDEIACRDAGLAVSTATAEQKPAQDGNIVIKTNGAATYRYTQTKSCRKPARRRKSPMPEQGPPVSSI